KAVALYPTFHFAHWNLAFAYLHLGKYEEAIAALEKALAFSHRASYALGLLGYTYARAGKRDEALQLSHELEERAHRGESVAIYRAMIHTALSDRDEAFRMLDVAINEHKHPVPEALHSILFDSIRSDLRWAALERKVFSR